MLKAVRIENLRSLKDTNFIELAPLTILVGKNSSGKSTFLRSFPLLTQSVNRRLRGPVSWFDANSVDFGDYNTAKNIYTNDSIRFSFKFDDSNERLYYARLPWRFTPDFRKIRDLKHFEISLSLNEDNDGTYIDNVVIKIDSGLLLKLNIEKRDSLISFFFNNEQISEYIPKIKFSFRTDFGIVPSIIPSSERDYRLKLIESACDILSLFCDKRTRNFKQIKDLFFHCNGYSRTSLLKSLKQTKLVSLKRAIDKWTIDSPDYMRVYKLYILSGIEDILSVANSYISNFYGSCGYIAPARAEALRYYRNQELQVDDVDPYGRNLQEFISSMNPKSLRYESFSRFTRMALGVNITVHNSTGNQSIYVSKGDTEFNLADVGFGYSQILPIITKLWHTTRSVKIRYPGNEITQRCVVMEQPELHLHPALQAKIADIFIATIHEANKNHIDLKLIIETHSPTIVNRIGKRINEGVFSKDKVNVLIFDKNDKTTDVKKASFKDNGQLENWPIGFFSPDDEPLILN